MTERYDLMYRAGVRARTNQSALTRRRLLATGVGSLGVALLAACGNSAKDTTGGSGPSASTGSADPPTTGAGRYTYAPKTGKTRDSLTVGVAGLPGGMDPAAELSNVGTRVTYNVYDTLIRRDFLKDDALVPALATAWERPDDLTFVLKLRDGVTFHNGDPMGAEDVKYTFERMRLPGSDLVEGRSYFAAFDAIDAVDRLTVRIRTKAPDPLVEKRLSSWASWIVPKAYIERLGGEQAFAKSGVGTGPFKVARLEPDNQLTLEQYEGYWEEKPPVRRLLFRVIPEVSARVTALLNNEVQIITNVPPDQTKSLQGAGNVDMRDIPLANLHVLSYGTKHPVLQDERFRQAMNLGIDRKLLVDSLWNGRAVLTRSHQFPEYGPLYNANRPLTAYDKQRAKSLVSESGYKGEPLTYRTQSGYYTNGLQAGQAIIQMWKEIGINAEIKLVGAGDREVPADRMVANWSNSSVLADPDGALWRSWGASSAVQRNYWTPADTEFNRLGQEARSILDVKRRYDNYQKMLDIWEKEAPGTVLYIPVENYGVSKEVNWSPYPFYYSDFRAYNLSFNK